MQGRLGRGSCGGVNQITCLQRFRQELLYNNARKPPLSCVLCLYLLSATTKKITTHFNLINNRNGSALESTTIIARLSFTIHPLDPQKRQIRLLTILPGSYLSGITCTWTIVSVDDQPDFEILSHTQENRTIAQPIMIDHKVILVRQTLWNALRRLRRQELPRTIWAYAFCVNRKDDAEKSHQTALMGPIYQECRKAILWLGEADSCALARMAAPPISCEIKAAFELLAMFDPDAHIDELPCYERDREGDVRENPEYREHFNGLRTLSECALWART